MTAQPPERRWDDPTPAEPVRGPLDEGEEPSNLGGAGPEPPIPPEPPPQPPPTAPLYAQPAAAEPGPSGWAQPPPQSWPESTSSGASTGAAPPQPMGAPAYGGAYQQAPAQRTNSMAIIALICSIGGLVTIISAPVGIVLGHMAKRQIAETGEEGGGLATAALIIGYVLTGLALAACCGAAIVVIIAVATSSA